MADLTNTITTLAQNPSEVHGDQGGMTAQPIPDVIAADNRVQAVQAMAGQNSKGGPKSAFRCLRIARAVPPGADGGC